MAVVLRRHGGDGGATAVLVRYHGGHHWTTLEISAPRCALMCYPSSNITYCIACLLCIGVILLNKFNSIQFTAVYAIQAPQWHRASGVTGV